ncbi:MAG: DUF4091 domain-containing protein [Phycisphaerae bacterium]|nr:DUF4091 domain-containing protein [Phycisphaerae bacterium]
MKSFNLKLMTALIVVGLCNIVTAQILQHPQFELETAGVNIQGDNIFLNTKTAGSKHWSDRAGKLAVDGKFDAAGAHWAAENIPVSLVLELDKARDLNVIRLWTYWGSGRYYQYKIEGSQDGQSWNVLVDQSKNTTAADAAGQMFKIATVKVKYVRVVFSKNSVNNASGGHIVEIQGYRLSDEQIKAIASWVDVPDGLQGAVTTTDSRFSRDIVPTEVKSKEINATAWKGDRVNRQILLWTNNDIKQVRFEVSDLVSFNSQIDAANIKMHFVRYTMGQKELCADILDNAMRMDIAGHTTRPVWVIIDVPSDATAGNYVGTIKVKAADQNDIEFKVALEVLNIQLPKPVNWQFHLDLWQNPFSIARYHSVDLWSPEHYALMKPLITMLADAGQKVITTSLIHEPWGGQTFDPFGPQIDWVKEIDGSWSFDYSVFDQWVQFCMDCGITKQIGCYSMVPWSNTFRYLDRASGDYKYLKASPGSQEYQDHWRPFLKDFSKHLTAKGWLDKTTISMDERPQATMSKLMAFLNKEFPEFKVELAANYPPKDFEFQGLSVGIQHGADEIGDIIKDRRNQGKFTTFYVCCGPMRPNTFPFSPPAEAVWLSWYASANGFDGFLRWAYCSWTEEPLLDTRYVRWPAGDCYFVYPGARSSIRFERTREGIVDFEKVAIVKAQLNKLNNQWAKEQLTRLDAALKAFTYKNIAKGPCAPAVNAAKATLEDIARQLAAKK